MFRIKYPNNLIKIGDFYCLKCKKSGDFSVFQDLTKLIDTKSYKCTDLLIDKMDHQLNRKRIKYLDEWIKSRPVKDINESQLKIILKSASCELNVSYN